MSDCFKCKHITTYFNGFYLLYACNVPERAGKMCSESDICSDFDKREEKK
jgi:hypothetical protein